MYNKVNIYMLKKFLQAIANIIDAKIQIFFNTFFYQQNNKQWEVCSNLTMWESVRRNRLQYTFS